MFSRSREDVPQTVPGQPPRHRYKLQTASSDTHEHEALEIDRSEGEIVVCGGEDTAMTMDDGRTRPFGPLVLQVLLRPCFTNTGRGFCHGRREEAAARQAPSKSKNKNKNSQQIAAATNNEHQHQQQQNTREKSHRAGNTDNPHEKPRYTQIADPSSTRQRPKPSPMDTLVAGSIYRRQARTHARTRSITLPASFRRRRGGRTTRWCRCTGTAPA